MDRSITRSRSGQASQPSPLATALLLGGYLAALVATVAAALGTALLLGEALPESVTWIAGILALTGIAAAPIGARWMTSKARQLLGVATQLTAIASAPASATHGSVVDGD